MFLFRDNTAISSEGDSVYQEYEDHTTYKISTLYFTNPLRKDAGRYDCLILSREGDQHPRVAAALTATLEGIKEIKDDIRERSYKYYHKFLLLFLL